MAVYTTAEAVKNGTHGMFESSNLKSAISGNVYDVIFEEDVDNGVGVSVGAFTGDGLQTREGAVITDVKKKIAVVGDPAIVKDSHTKGEDQPYNYVVKAGKATKVYEVVEDDIFAIADYQITTGKVAKKAFVVLDGAGAYKIVSTDPKTTNGFVGEVHSVATGTYYTIVRIHVLQNKDI